MASRTGSFYTQQRYHQTAISLPSEEYRTLCRAQDRERLNKHFEHQGNRLKPAAAPYSAYRQAGLPQDERVRISEVKSATRAALGASFDLDDDSYGRLEEHEHEYQRSRGWVDDTPPRSAIPQKYLDEFNRLWHEDDEDNDADQYLADHSHGAPWRKHVPLEHYKLAAEPIRNKSRTKPAPSRGDSGYGREPERPRLPPSKFSSESSERPSGKRGFFNRLSRHLR
jgi:hypothetical protein